MSNLTIIIIVFLLLISVPCIIVAIVIKGSKEKRKKKLRQYTQTTEGSVIKLDNRGIDGPTVVTVAYEVNQCRYEISETVKLKIELIKLGPIPIGQRKRPVMGDVQVGAKVSVCYDSQNPAQALLADNEGSITG